MLLGEDTGMHTDNGLLNSKMWLSIESREMEKLQGGITEGRGITYRDLGAVGRDEVTAAMKESSDERALLRCLVEGKYCGEELGMKLKNMNERFF